MPLISIGDIKNKAGINPNGRAQQFFTNTCYKHMGKYVPGGDTGILNTNHEIGTDYIKYTSPYAHYQYVGKLYVMENGKGAYYSPDYGYWSKPGVTKIPTDRDLVHTSGTSFWDNKMWNTEKDKVIQEVQDYVDRGVK